VDDVSLLELNLKEATKLILGQPGSTVSLQIQTTAGHGGKQARKVGWSSNKVERVPLRRFGVESWAEARARAHLRLARQSQCGKESGKVEDRENSVWPAWRPVALDSLPKLATSGDAPADASENTTKHPPPLASLKTCDAHGFSNGTIIQSLVDNDTRLTSLNLADISVGSARTSYILKVLAQRNTTLTSLKLGGGSGAMSVREQVQQMAWCVLHYYFRRD